MIIFYFLFVEMLLFHINHIPGSSITFYLYYMIVNIILINSIVFSEIINFNDIVLCSHIFPLIKSCSTYNPIKTISYDIKDFV